MGTEETQKDGADENQRPLTDEPKKRLLLEQEKTR